MRILFLNQYYYPDIAATAQLLADVCEDLAAAGHDVTVLCGAGRYRLPHLGTQPVAAAGPLAPLPARELHRGVNIRRIFEPSFARGTGMWRLLSRAAIEARFCAAALSALSSLVAEGEAPDVVVALSSPPLLLPLGLAARARLRAPLVYWVQDLYPELLFALRALGGEGSAHRLAEAALPRLWRWLYHGVDAAVALDAAMAGRLAAAGMPAERIHVVEHFADCREIAPQPASENRLRQTLGLGEDAFVIGYAGNLGRGHDFETVAAALALLARPDAPSGASDLHFLFIGDGEKRAALFAAVPPALRTRVHFLPPQARSELRDVLTAGDVGLITLAEGLSGLMVPSKLYALLAAGRPIVYVGPPTGRVAELCAVEQIGESVGNGDAAGLLSAWLRLLRDPLRRAALARRCRELAESRFERGLITAQHAALLSKIAAEGTRGGRAGR